MKRYFVYLIMVDRKLMYYGRTSNFETRKREHIREVQKLLDTGTANSKKLVHNRIAEYLMKSKANQNTSRMAFSICYISDDLQLAKEVELFLINSSIHNKNCCNTKTHY